MIIAIDGYEANEVNRVGIGEYAFEILSGIHTLLANREAGNETRVRIYLPSEPNGSLPSAASYWSYRRSFPRKLWTYIGLPFRLLFDMPRANVVFSPTHYIPRVQIAPHVMAIMDISYLKYPELFRAKDLYQLREWTAYSVKKSARILTISEFSRNAIIEAYKVAPEKVVVTYPGLRVTTVASMQKKEDVLRKYNIPERYLLSVGTIQPRKNYEKLIQAFSEAKKKKPEVFKNVKLIIVGKKGWLYEPILAAPSTYGVLDSVQFVDFIPDEDLAVLYQQAMSFVLVSLYEGFGLPVLEAMANKCQVVISNVSSLPEIAANAGIQVDPLNIDAIAEGLITACREYGTSAWEKRVNDGLKRSAEFTWDRAATKALEVLESVGKGTT
jgi:glycosyltransferase involved in cell wall biosynthesis